MSRKAEFLAVVKTIVDKDSNKKAKQSTIELAQELSDILNSINVKPGTDDFKELKDVFNEQLAEMGKQPIVFSENTLKGIASQFANAISDGIKAGVSSIDGEIAKLTKQRESLLEERDALNKQMKNKTLKEKLSNFNPLTTTPLEVSGDLKEEAIRIRKEFTDAYYELVDFTDDDGKFNTQLEGYEDAVLKAQQKAIQLMRMQKTLALNKDPSLNKQREKYAELIDGEEIEIVGDAFEELDDVFTEQSMRLEDIKITLQDINTKIQELQNKKVDIISDDNKEDVSYILKSLEEIEAAYNRISQKNGKLGKTSTKELNAALDPQQEFLSLTQLYGKYNTASETGAGWEKLYNYAVRYVNKFESDLNAGKISKDRLPKYTELYDTLKPIANDARESLKLLAEFKPTKSTSTQKQKSTEDIAPALHENNELLKRLLSDKEKSTFYDSKTGRYTPVKIGSENQVENSLDDVIKASKIYDTGIHSHRYKIAAPSVLGEDNDMDTWAKAIEYIKKRSIVAREEVLSFDFSSLTKEDIQNIIMQYKEAASVVQKEFDDIRVNLQIGEKFGSFENFEEALQVRLREELEKIMQQYPGVMSSHAISLSTADASTRKSAENEDAAKFARKAKDRINFLQQPRSDTTGETEVEANQKKIKSYEDLLAIVQQYYNLKSKLRSINSDYPDGIDAQDYNPPIRAEMDSIEKLLSSKQINKEVLSVYEALNSDYSINEALQKIANALGIEIPQAARVAEGAVGNLNSELREGQSLMSQTPGSSALTGTGDASSEELKSLQNKNDQLRQEKENAEKDRNAANERANKAEAEAERLRNELANRDKVDSDKSPSGATSIDTSELESLLSRVTYKVKFEGESPLDNSAAVLETVKSALGNIQVNASADKDAPWAREATLSGVIKNTLENIKSNTTGLSDAIKIAIAKTGEKVKEPVVKDYKKVTKDDYAGSTYFPEKLKTQVSKIEEYRAKLATSGRLTQEMDKQIDDLLEKLRLVKNGPEFSVWSEEFKKLRIDENTSKIFDDFIGKENKNLYQELIDLKKQEYEWEIKLLNAQQGSAEETNARQELEVIQEKIKNHSVVYEDYEQELKLQKMQEEQLRKINELSSKQVDSNNKQKLKEETETVKELNELYQQLAQAKAMADAETDSILRKPLDDRVNQMQSEIDAKEANIDRAKYSQQFDNTQKESYKKQIVEELLELYAKLGEAEAKEDRMSIGNATAQQNKSEMDALYKRIEATQKLIDVNEELQNQFDAAQKIASDKVVVKANKADAVSDDKSFEKLGKQYEKLGKLRAQAQSTGSAVTQEDARQLEEAIKKEQERVSLSKEQTEELKRRLEVARQNELLRQNSIKQQKSFEQQIKDSRSQARLNTVNSTIRSAEDINRNAMMIDGVSSESLSKMKELNQAIELLKQKYAEINAKGGVVSDEDQKDVVNQIANVKKLSSEVNDLVKEYNNMNDDNAKTIGKFNGQLNGASIDEYKRQLTEAIMAATNGKASIKGFDAETKTLTYSLKAGSHEFTNYTAAVRGADGALVSIQKETKRAETFIESLTRKTKEIGTYLISSLSLYDVVNKFRQGIQYVREIDSALTELKKVTDETEETYDRFLNTASKTAGKVGSTIKEIVSSTADWARLGYSMEEAAQLAESTSVLLNVSEFSSIDDATSALISTMQAFGYAAKDSMHVVDVMNEIGNNYAVSSDGIATALQDSASSLMAANNSYQEAVALIASANKVVQDPNSVGAALRTISLRLRGTSTKELEEAGEDTEGTITSKSKLRSKIKTLSGVDILTDTGAYKSTYQILLEISKVWEKMSDIDQAECCLYVQKCA